MADVQALELIRAQASIPTTRWCARLGIPRATWYRRLHRARHGAGPKGPWPAPVVDTIAEDARVYAERWAAWGHRKVAAMMRADGHTCSESSVFRSLARQGLIQPADYQRQRRELAKARKATFIDPPDRRNRVWQVDFSEVETLGGGIWRLCAVVDYAAKVCLACRVSTTMTHRDAVLALDQARQRAAELLALGRLAEDLLDTATGELSSVTVVSDNGPAFKAGRFAAYIAGARELAHVRTRHKAPETNGVVERFFQTIKYEDLYRHEIPDGPTLHTRVIEAVDVYNRIRPHETLGQVTPLSIYLADPNRERHRSVSES